MARPPNHRGGRKPAAQTVTFKCPGDLLEGLDTLVAEASSPGVEITRSHVIRYILRRAVGQPQEYAIFHEEMAFFVGHLMRRVGRVAQCVRSALKDELNRETEFDRLQLPSGADDEDEVEEDAEIEERSGSRA